ncbi:glycosyltransferase [Oscillibacter sp.]|uniref:glycosyltransferase family 2 protein n=1 Tax=Oscillibacter sp. TaxID=1945593 RepID=UPI00339AC37E
METLRFVINVNMAIVVLMTVAYLYQYLYTIIGLIFRKVRPEKEASRLHRFATLICARNEEGVIGELIDSLKKQNYPSDLLDIYVLADNCTDNTARTAREAGAIVYERYNQKQVGKGYALDTLLFNIKEDKGSDAYDGYFIFDADNIVDPNFVNEMNKTFDRGYEVITCYRNSKNFSANWITAGYSIWFLREARFLNYPRMLLGNSCAVSGTGFFVSQRMIDENDGWPFHLLTEDIQFSVNCVISGHKIGYCDGAIVYDEQPTSFSQSWNQRLRWAKGFFQVNKKYALRLIKGVFTSSAAKMSCYDFLMTVAPCVFLAVFAVVFNLLILLGVAFQPHFWMHLIIIQASRYLMFAVVDFYIGLAIYGALTVACEWKRIKATSWQKIRYILLFPIFMATYVPITFVALKRNVSWTHIEHNSVSKFDTLAIGSQSGH